MLRKRYRAEWLQRRRVLFVELWADLLVSGMDVSF